MPDIPILRPETRWACPNCDLTDVTHNAGPHSRFHSCAGLKGISAPMIVAAEVAKVAVRAVVRADYLNGEKQETNEDGVPIMAVETEYWDGHTDLSVNPGVAQAELRY